MESWEEMHDWALSQQGRVLANLAIQAELAETGRISLRSLQREFGYAEGQAAFMVRHLQKSFDDRKFADYQKRTTTPADDGYFYHVTLKKRLPLIRRDGLLPDSAPLFSNYATYSGGRIFLCDRDGIGFWKERVEQHAFHNGWPTRTVVLKIRKDKVPAPHIDKTGSEDSRHKAYYTTEAIPSAAIEVTRL